MKAVFRWIAAHNFIPIISSSICYNYFSTLGSQASDYFFIFGAAFFCWLFYFIDKILDNRNRRFRKEERHYLSESDKKFQWLIGSLLLGATLANFHLFPLTTLFTYMIAVPACLYYLKFIITSHRVPKELFSSLIISITLCLLPILLNGNLQYLAVYPIFFLMVFGNMTLLAITDQGYDKQHSFNSLAKSMKETNLILMLVIVMLAILLFAFNSGLNEIKVWSVSYCLIYSAIMSSRKWIDHNLVHLISDTVFIIPLF